MDKAKAGRPSEIGRTIRPISRGANRESAQLLGCSDPRRPKRHQRQSYDYRKPRFADVRTSLSIGRGAFRASSGGRFGYGIWERSPGPRAALLAAFFVRPRSLTWPM